MGVGRLTITPQTAHDPTTYVAFAKQFSLYAASIDPQISIGVNVTGPTSDYNNWVGNVLQQSVAQGFMPRVPQRPQLRSGTRERERPNFASSHRQ